MAKRIKFYALNAKKYGIGGVTPHVLGKRCKEETAMLDGKSYATVRDMAVALSDMLAESARSVEKIDRLKITLVAAREYIDMVRKNHWPDAIPAANIIHDIDAALGGE